MDKVIQIPDVVWLWGPGVLILLLGYFAFRSFAKYIGTHFLEDFLKSQRKQADAISELADILKKQMSAEEITRREILLVMRIQRQKLEELGSELKEIKQLLLGGRYEARKVSSN